MPDAIPHSIQLPRWHWYNSGPPADPSPVSILAFCETLAASIVYLVIAAKFGTQHLTVAVCIAPFLLLRTPQSTELGVHLGERLSFLTERSGRSLNWVRTRFSTLPVWGIASYASVLLVLVVLMIGLISLFALALSTVITFWRHPIASIAAIPANWWRLTARVDSTTRPESIYGILDRMNQQHESEEILGDFDPIGALSFMWSGTSKYARIAALPGFVFYSVCVLLPSLFYRWSIKGTTLIFSPFIYIVHNSFSANMRDRLADICDLAHFRLRRGYAVFAIFLFAAKLYLFAAWNDFAVQWDALPGVEFFNAYIMPKEVALWHVASAINAVLAWGIYLFADVVLKRNARSTPTQPLAPWTGMVVSTVGLVQGVLAIYTIMCVAYITASLAPNIHFPPLGSQFFPWS